MRKFLSRYTPLQIAMHLYAWSTIARLLIEIATGTTSVNPIQELEQRTGRHAITLLILSLACTPLNTLFGWREFLKRRRALGLYTFMYATIHVIIFVDIDHGLAWSLILRTVADKPFILIGMASFLLLIPIAFTSFDIWKARLGKNWKRLHQVIYFIAPLVIVHFIMSKKGNILTLQGDIIRPFIYGLVLLLLLIFRIPIVRTFLASLRGRIWILFNKPRPQPE